VNAIEQFTGIHDASGEPRAHRELAVRRIRRNSRKRLGPERFSFGAEHGQQGVDSSCGNANGPGKDGGVLFDDGLAVAGVSSALSSA
jgi:hypothetical protein